MRISDWRSDVCSSDLPGGARADDTGGSQKARKIADCVVARAYPERAHVGVATAVALEQEGNAAVRDQRDHPDDSHCLAVRHPAAQRRTHRCDEDIKTEGATSGRAARRERGGEDVSILGGSY